MGKNPRDGYGPHSLPSLQQGNIFYTPAQQQLLYTMDFPVENLDSLPAADFETAISSLTGSLNVELLAQLRDNGRILDHWRLTVGGSKVQQLLVPMTEMFQLPSLSEWRFKMQFWARDVLIRRNMTTSIWVSISTILAAREAQVIDDSDQLVPTEAVLAEIEKAKADSAIRWAVVIGEDERLRLHTQLLPTSAESLSGKPVLRG